MAAKMTKASRPLSRSETMRRVHSQDTAPEFSVRSLLHSLGYRFRLHRRDLPGVPDIVFPSRRCVLFVHGCFWHGHECPRGGRIPKTRTAYWLKKRAANLARDARHHQELDDLGWRWLVLWECELKDRETLTQRLATFLGPAPLP